MKVSELIAELSKLDQTMEVYVNDHIGQVVFDVIVTEDDTDSSKLVCVLAQ